MVDARRVAALGVRDRRFAAALAPRVAGAAGAVRQRRGHILAGRLVALARAHRVHGAAGARVAAARPARAARAVGALLRRTCRPGAATGAGPLYAALRLVLCVGPGLRELSRPGAAS